MSCSSMQSRVFINDKQSRLLLKKYASTATDNTELAKYLDSDLEYLMKLLKIHSPVLEHLINQRGRTIPCMFSCATLFKELSATTPVCAL